MALKTSPIKGSKYLMIDDESKPTEIPSLRCGPFWYVVGVQLVHGLHNQKLVSGKYLVFYPIQVVKGSTHGKMLV